MADKIYRFLEAAVRDSVRHHAPVADSPLLFVSHVVAVRLSLKNEIDSRIQIGWLQFWSGLVAAEA